jgi:hypothetical protein
VFKRALLAVALIAGLSVPTQASGDPGPDLQLEVNGQDTGRVFDGIGALSGNTSRLLVDYPEPQRSQLLDYLFKPGYGASLQHLKTDMGSDGNAGEGSEPATKHEPDDESWGRGYQWWIMSEAKKRNPNIKLSLLQAEPGWVGGFFTQANLDNIINYLKGAKKHWGLTFDYVAGVVNEPTVIHQKVDWDWVKRLKRELVRNGLPTRMIVGDDQVRTCCPTNLPWQAGEAMRADPELRAAVDVIGSHYAGGTTPDYVKEFGIPVWSSEDGPWIDGWNEFKGGAFNALGSTYNLNYINGRMTSTQIWNLASAYYDNLLLPNSGLLRAAEPWSGHYEVTSPIWVTAHTTQFAQPGWRYLDHASRVLPKGGSVVALRSPGSGDYSAIFETQRSQPGAVPTESQTVRVQVGGGLGTGSVHVWRSTKDQWFTQQPDIPVVNGSFEITLQPDAIYSVTTTTGQHKGDAGSPPASTPFPRSYRDDFESGQLEQQPRYLAQQGGSYELTRCAGGRPGRCVEQAVRHQPIEWLRADPTTFLGDAQGWTDVSVESKVFHLQPGYAEVWARIGNAGGRGTGQNLDVPILPDGYYLSVQQTGRWELGYTVHGERHRLAADHATMPAGAWHTIKISAVGKEIRAYLDGTEVGHATDSTYASGRAGIGTGWNRVQFDDLTITP